MTAVLMVKDSAITWSETWAATDAKAGTPESNDPGPMKASNSEARIIKRSPRWLRT